MAKKNSGKIFEGVFKASAEKQGLCIDRIKDAGDISAYKTKRNVKNIADFIMYEYPNIYFLELKARTSNRINFNVLTPEQYEGLLKKHSYTGVYSGVVFLYLPDKYCYFIPIYIIKLLKDIGIKSLTKEDCEVYGVELPINKKRVSYTIDFNSFKSDIENKDWLTLSRRLQDEHKNKISE
jgi:hypothetical protein